MGFDPSKPFEVEGAAASAGPPPFDPSKPFALDAAPGRTWHSLPVAPEDEGAAAGAPTAGAAPAKPEPSLWDVGRATGAGVTDATRELMALPDTLRGKAQAHQEQPYYTEPLSWGDLVNPSAAAPKIAYGLAKSFPMMAGGIAGGAVGAALTAETGPGAALGALGGGAVGAGAVSAVQSLSPYFAAEMAKPGATPDGAFQAAMLKAGEEGAFSAASWALFGVAPFRSAVKNLMLQAVGVQPAVSVAHKATGNITEGRPIGENLTEGVPGAIAGTAVPAAGHAAVARALRTMRPEMPVGTAPANTPETTEARPGATEEQLATETAPGAPRPARATPDIAATDGVSPELAAAIRAGEVEAQAMHAAGPRQASAESAPAPVAPAPRQEAAPAPPPAAEPVWPVAPGPRAPRPEELPVMPPEPPRAPPPEPAREAQPIAGGYAMLDPFAVRVDPERFQYKAADERGVTGALQGTTRWEPALANPITVWRDQDGVLYVVNGHQRTDLARRATEAGQEGVQLPARVFDARDGYTPEQMRALGAYQNIAEGSGTALDAAKVMRSVASLPPEVQMPELPPRQAMVQQGRALAKLSDEAFGAVINGVVPPEHAAAVGARITDPAEQMAALDVLRRAAPANVEQARLIVEDIRNSGFLRGEQSTLFGDEAFAHSLVAERARVLDNAMRVLRRNRGVFKAAVEGEETLSAAGNRLSRAGNLEGRTQNDQLLDAIARDALVRGDLSDALSAAARELAGGKQIGGVTSKFLTDARKIVARGPTEDVSPRADHGGAGPEGEGPVEGQSPLFSRRLPAPPPTGPDMFGERRPERQAREPESTIRADQRQVDMFGRADAAVQAQAARDQTGRGMLAGKGEQRAADEGLFRPPERDQGALLASPRGWGAIEGHELPRPEAVQALVDAAVRRTGGHVRVEAHYTPDGLLRIKMPGGKTITAEGAALGRLIWVAVRMDRTGWNLDHETVHALRNLGVFKPAEWKALEEAARRGRWAEEFGIERRYPELSPEKRAEEAIAEKFAQYIGEPKRASGLVQQAMRSVQQFFERLRSALAGRGFHTAEDIFGRVDRGEVGARRPGAHGPERGPRGVDESAAATSRWMSRDTMLARERDVVTGRRQIDSPEFKRWFGDSKVVDEAGEPLVVYHGTQKGGFEEFRPGSHFGTAAAAEDRLFDQNKWRAVFLRRRKPENLPGRYGQADAVYPVYLDIKNPKRVLDVGDESAWRREIERAKEEGHDGLVYLNTEEGVGDDSWVAFRPEQIKSAIGNRGTFDPADPRIAFSRPETPEQERTPLPLRPTPARIEGALQTLSTARRSFADIIRGAIAPITTGNTHAQAEAARFANAEAKVSNWLRMIDKALRNDYTPEQRRRMFEALDDQSLFELELREAKAANPEQAAQIEAEARAAFAGRGLDSLPAGQRNAIEALDRVSQTMWQAMRDRGMLQNPDAEGLPYWAPRRFVLATKDGKATRIPGGGEGGSKAIDPLGLNLTTAGPMRRNIRITEDSLRALRQKYADADLVRDIRILPQALAHEMRAVAGSDLVRAIRDYGNEVGFEPITTEVPPGQAASYRTIDHPALMELKPAVRKTPDGGWDTVRDADGNAVMVKSPMKVHVDFEGPLRAVLTRPQSKLYSGLLAMKNAAVGMIMYSPMIHNAVEWSRAFPLMGLNMLWFKPYTEGHRLGRDHAYMANAIDHGLRPVGGSWRSDATGIYEQARLNPGNSAVSRSLGAMGDIVSKDLGNRIRGAVDAAGEFWHQKLLWDQVRALQVGIYDGMLRQYLAAGKPPEVAATMAAHLANRYAGALPREAMSNAANMAANLGMFSRSFTLGNLGAMKDMFNGMPSYVRAQLERVGGPEAVKDARTALQRKAIAAFVIDLGLTYIGNALLQNVVQYALGEQDLDEIARGYFRRMADVATGHWKSMNPLENLTPNAENEPGKEGRIYAGRDATGTAAYFRNPLGKIGEDFAGWITQPLKTAMNKAAPMPRAIIETMTNVDSQGKPIRNMDAHGFIGSMDNAGAIVGHIAQSFFPVDNLAATWSALNDATRVARGMPAQDPHPAMNAAKAVGPMLGVSVSRGYPGGPQEGEKAAILRNYQFLAAHAGPEARKMVQRGDLAGALEYLQRQGLTERDATRMVRNAEVPERGAAYREKQIARIATPEQRAAIDRLRAVQ